MGYGSPIYNDPYRDQIVAIPVNSGVLNPKVYVIHSETQIITGPWVSADYLLIRNRKRSEHEMVWFSWLDILNNTNPDVFELIYDELTFGKTRVPPYWLGQNGDRYLLVNQTTILSNGELLAAPSEVSAFFSDMHPFQDDWFSVPSIDNKYVILSYEGSDYLIMETDLSNPRTLSSSEWSDLIWSASDDVLVGVNHDGFLYELNPASPIFSESERVLALPPDFEITNYDIKAWSNESGVLIYSSKSEGSHPIALHELFALDLNTNTEVYLGQISDLSTVSFIDNQRLVYWEFLPANEQSWFEPKKRQYTMIDPNSQEQVDTVMNLVMFDLTSMQKTIVLNPNWVRLRSTCRFRSDFMLFENQKG
jgi:hypothetical protein